VPEELSGRRDPSALPRRFHSTIRDMPVPCCDGRHPLPNRPREHAPGRTRTCDPLLRRGEHLLRSTAACRSVCSASDGPRIAAAFCCGLPLPQRFHVDPPAFTPSDSEVSELAAHLLFVRSDSDVGLPRVPRSRERSSGLAGESLGVTSVELHGKRNACRMSCALRLRAVGRPLGHRCGGAAPADRAGPSSPRAVIPSFGKISRGACRSRAGELSCGSRSCVRAATFRRFLSRAGARSRRCWRWCSRPPHRSARAR
jgi:hypothetical protein